MEEDFGTGNYANLTTLSLSDNWICNLPTSLATIPLLQHLNLAGNQIYELPNSLESVSFTSFNVDRNRLTFKDLMPYKDVTYVFTYANQDFVGATGIAINGCLQSRFKFKTEVDLELEQAPLTHQWYYANSATGAGSALGQTTVHEDANIGYYYYTVRHSDFPNLTLISYRKQIKQ